jgi:hypothetical protein
LLRETEELMRVKEASLEMQEREVRTLKTQYEALAM